MWQRKFSRKGGCGKPYAAKKVAVTPFSRHLRRVNCWLKADCGLFLPDAAKITRKCAAAGIFVPHPPTSAAIFTVPCMQASASTSVYVWLSVGCGLCVCLCLCPRKLILLLVCAELFRCGCVGRSVVLRRFRCCCMCGCVCRSRQLCVVLRRLRCCCRCICDSVRRVVICMCMCVCYPNLKKSYSLCVALYIVLPHRDTWLHAENRAPDPYTWVYTA